MSKKNDLHANLIAASDIKPTNSDLETLRSRLAQARGAKYWRTLEEFADDKAFGEMLEREFPRQASEWVDGVSRRNFLKLSAASLALAGLAGCTRQPLEQILPYVRQPEELVPGKPMFYATAMPFAGYGIPVLVESHEFRPTKIEGNPQHAASLGATDLFTQASILNLYDPDRSTTFTHLGESRTWSDFLVDIRKHVLDQRQKQGAGLRFLTGAMSSPTMAAQFKEILQAFPQAKWHRYDPVHRDNVRAGSRAALGAYYDPIYKFDAADVVVSLDGDFLSGAWFPGFVRYARDFMGRRKNPKSGMNRLYVAESSPTTTGMKADHRLSLRPSEIAQVARALAAQFNKSAGPSLPAEQQKWVDAVAAELGQSRGKSLVVPGEFQTPEVHALAHAMNAALDNVGKTVSYIDPVEVDPVEHTQSIRELVSDMNAGKVEVLIMLGVNPVYEAPADLDFAAALEKMLGNSDKSVVQLSLYKNDTTGYSSWHIPETHYLESWSDGRSYDGTATIVQPLILPLYDGKSAHQLLAVFQDTPSANPYDLVRSYWQSQHQGADFEQWWRRSVHNGVIDGTAHPARQVSVNAHAGAAQSATAAGGGEYEIIFRPDPCIYDGKFVNNGWLQETPKPLTRTTWDNVAMISPKMAEKWRLDQVADENDHQSDAQNVLEIEFQGRKVRAPYWAQPGHPDNAVTLFLGYGQKTTGRVGTGAGYNAYSVRPVAAQYQGQGASIASTKDFYPIAVTQGHFSMENRELVKAADLEEFRSNPKFAHPKSEIEPGDLETLYRPDNFPYNKEDYNKLGYAWGMAIDLNSCIGCQACAVACQAENNISVVGKEQVQRGREMQWIRIDAYYEGDPANPVVHFQPVPCMQCENAPCEPVCPVGATVHSTEGLNDMVYNRCVGTRYCSNNCPYKVRRFNFLLFADYTTPSLKLMRNPDVTVRSRGVMEKCTYCVQRINAARINAEKEDRKIKDGEITPACAQACPTQAIIFGDIQDPNSRVSKLKADERNYALLAEINTRPRTTYIAAVRNPNPELKKA